MKLTTIASTILLPSACHAFMVPTVPANVEQWVVQPLPHMDEPLPWLDITTKTALVPFIIYSPFANPKTTSESSINQTDEDEIDYDAPLDRQLKVDHIVRRQPYTIGLGNQGTFTPPPFLQQTLHLYEPEHKFELPTNDMDEHYFSLVHDECYLGKDCMAKECVDFDPVVSTRRRHGKRPFHIAGFFP